MQNTRNIRRLVFHRAQHFCRGIVDQSYYILCLLESESPDGHQIAVEMISGDEHSHISNLPTSMKRDGYTLCNFTVCNGFSDLRQVRWGFLVILAIAPLLESAKKLTSTKGDIIQCGLVGVLFVQVTYEKQTMQGSTCVSGFFFSTGALEEYILNSLKIILKVSKKTQKELFMIIWMYITHV